MIHKRTIDCEIKGVVRVKNRTKKRKIGVEVDGFSKLTNNSLPIRLVLQREQNGVVFG